MEKAKQKSCKEKCLKDTTAHGVKAHQLAQLDAADMHLNLLYSEPGFQRLLTFRMPHSKAHWFTSPLAYLRDPLGIWGEAGFMFGYDDSKAA